MKKLLRAAGFLALSSISTAVAMEITFHNENIGPIKGGEFLRDQQYLATTKLPGKNPGSGLFLIPNGTNHEDPSFPLFFLVPTVRYTLKGAESIVQYPDDELIKSWFCSDNRDNVLGLPGESKKVTLLVDYEKVLTVSFSLKTCCYGFTTSGGSVWCTHLDKLPSITQEISIAPYKNIDVTFSWPKIGPYTGKWQDSYLSVSFQKPRATVNRENLDPEWKSTIGLHVDGTRKNESRKPWCYLTRGLSRSFDSAGDAIDIMKLNDDFSFYAGHPLDVTPFSK